MEEYRSEFAQLKMFKITFLPGSLFSQEFFDLLLKKTLQVFYQFNVFE